MTTKGLLVRLSAQSGKDEEVESFLQSALPLVEQEPATAAWFAIKFGRGDYGIVDFFPDEGGREAHLSGAVAQALREKAGSLFDESPRIQKLTVIADKLPASGARQTVAKGLLLTFKPHEGHEQRVEQFLRDAKSFVMEEEKTIAWFAIHLDDGDFGIFDVFPDNAGRFAHLTGKVPIELTKHALSLLGGFPDMEMNNVLASKLGH